MPSTSQTLFCVHSDTEGPSYTSVASIPTHSPHVVSTHGPSDADAALPGTDCESYQESGSSVHLTASDIASHQTTSTQCLSSSTGVPLQAFRSCAPSFPPPLVCCSPTDDPSHSPFVLSFIRGNICVCRGCRQSYAKPALPPMDLCVHHQEWQEFFPPGASTAQVRQLPLQYPLAVHTLRQRCSQFLLMWQLRCFLFTRNTWLLTCIVCNVSLSLY